jgi:outer membrane protein TolC
MRVRHRLLTGAVSALALIVSGGARDLEAQAGPKVLTLREAIGQALVRGERMLEQRDSVEQSQLAVLASRNEFRPKVVPAIQGSFGQTDVNDQTYRLDVSQRFVTGTQIRVGAGTSTAQVPAAGPGLPDVRFYNGDTTLMVSQPLLKGFGRDVARRQLTAAEFRQADSRRRRTLASQQVAVDVAGAYYRVVAQEAVSDVARQSFERARQLREVSEAKMEAGLVSQLDVLRAQQLVLQAELQLFDAQAAVEDARDQLRFLIGDDSTAAPFQVDPVIPKFVDMISAEDATATALTQRLDLQSAIENARDADVGTSYARNQLRPQFDVNLALTRRQTGDSIVNSFGLDGFQFATFFTISMPVDRTSQLVDYQNALIDRDRRRRDIDTVRKRIADDVRRSLRERDRGLRNLTAAESSVAIAQREVEVAQLRYERGLSNNLDVVTAETNLLNAESRRILTLAELAVANLTLQATMGTLDPEAIAQAPAPVGDLAGFK